MQGTNTKISEKIGAAIVFSQECKSIVCQYGQEIVYLLQKWLHDACLLAKEWRGGRAASFNIIPSSTSAAKVYDKTHNVVYSGIYIGCFHKLVISQWCYVFFICANIHLFLFLSFHRKKIISYDLC